MIPRRLVRCIPAEVPPRWEQHWQRWRAYHPGWEHLTIQDPIAPEAYPVTSPVWDRCRAGAALAGLVRLEELHARGGIFLDWDVRPARSLEPLLDPPGGMFAAWEDPNHVPDAVFGCEPGHPAVAALMELACAATAAGASVWECSVGLFTELLPDRPDVTLMGPESFYPVHYSTERAHPGASALHEPGPDTYGVHEWAWSWGPG
jgi:hypothetical protein